MNFDYNTSNFLPLIVLVAGFFIFAISGCSMLIWEKIKSIFLWFLDPDFGLGPTNNSGGYDNLGQYHYPTPHTPYQQKKKCIPHLHKWAFDRKERHNWMVIDGKPLGTRNHIENIIKVVVERPGHTETKLSTLTEWRNKGFNVVYTSWNHWRCSVCGETKQTEFYETPTKEDPQTAPPILDLNELIKIADSNKKKTQQINTTIYKREIAVEPMKWYR